MLNNGSLVHESLSIVRVLAKSHDTFCGCDSGSKMQVSMWVDFINGSVIPAAQRVISQCNGTCKDKMGTRAFSIAEAELVKMLATIDSHVRLRNFFVGYSLTLADAMLVN